METITKLNIRAQTKGFPIDCKYHKSMYRQQNFPFSFLRIQKKTEQTLILKVSNQKGSPYRHLRWIVNAVMITKRKMYLQFTSNMKTESYVVMMKSKTNVVLMA